MSLAAEHRLLTSLNPAQREAVAHPDGPLLVLAGAGSGKTRVLTTRIASLIETRGVDPWRILAVTFTNKAAGEMRERVASLLGARPAGMWIGTFHAIGARILRSSAHLVGLSSTFTIYDQDDTRAAVKRAMDRLDIDPKRWAPRAIQAAISDAKNALVGHEEYSSLARDPFTRAAAAVYVDLDRALRVANAVDFDDLLVLPVRLLSGHPAELHRYRERFHHVLVDEYQDTNRAQYQFIRLIGGERGNVCVVGDDDQSIYGWRGADIRNILDFGKDFPEPATVRLEENYRSTRPILDLANAVICHNTARMGKTLRSTVQGSEPVVSIRSLDDRDEADWVANQALSLKARGESLDEIAVLYRTNSQSRSFEDAMRRHAIPYRLVGAVRFYERREIRDLVSYLKLIANPADDEAFRRAVAVPRRGIGGTTVELLAQRAAAAGIPIAEAAAMPGVLADVRPAARASLREFLEFLAAYRERAESEAVHELLRDIVSGLRYDDHLRAEGPEGAERVDNVRELIASAAEVVEDELGEVGMRPLDRFLQRASLVADVDSLDGSAGSLVLMTLHNSKGLEFRNVFITGLENGLFPLARAIDDPDLLEEERRLFYVGITRAKQRLYLTHAEERRRNGELVRSRHSMFLDEIPDAMLDRRSTPKVRSSGRSAVRGGAWGSRGFDGRGTRSPAVDEFGLVDTGPPSARRAGTPVALMFSHEMSSDDEPSFNLGARVRHGKFGTGTVAGFTGAGRDAKVKIDFDDEMVGRKTLVVAQANLSRGDE